MGNRSFWEPAHELVREQSADGLFLPWPRQEWLLPVRPYAHPNFLPSRWPDRRMLLGNFYPAFTFGSETDH